MILPSLASPTEVRHLAVCFQAYLAEGLPLGPRVGVRDLRKDVFVAGLRWRDYALMWSCSVCVASGEAATACLPS